MATRESNELQLEKIALVTAGIMLLAAPLPVWPYGYYRFLRLVVCAATLFVGYGEWTRQRIPIAAALFGVALLFNPLAPVYLTRLIWLPINLGAAAGLLALARQYDRAPE